VAVVSQALVMLLTRLVMASTLKAEGSASVDCVAGPDEVPNLANLDLVKISGFAEAKVKEVILGTVGA
jgi:hypothetical protein